MEAATVFSLARRRGLAAGAICTVDGNLVAGNQKGADSEDELPEKAKNNVARAIDIALDSVVDLERE
jgi:uridine phosphorylase